MRLEFSSSLIIQVPFFGSTTTFSSVYYRDLKQKGEWWIFMFSLSVLAGAEECGSRFHKGTNVISSAFIKNVFDECLACVLFLINTGAWFNLIMSCYSRPGWSNCSFHLCRPGSTGTGIWSFFLIRALMDSTTLFGPTLAMDRHRVVKMTGSPWVRIATDKPVNTKCTVQAIVLLSSLVYM